MSSLVDRSAKCNHDSDGRIAGFEMLYLHNIYGDGHTDGRTNGRIERVDRSTYGWMNGWRVDKWIELGSWVVKCDK